MAQIVNMGLDQMVDHLTTELITNIPTNEPIRADVVKKGLLTDNKTQKGIQIGVQGGDHEQPDEMDGISVLQKLPRIAMDIPPRELGGGQFWMRRGVVKVEAYILHQQVKEKAAFALAYDLLGRVMKHIETCPIYTLAEDDFGEKTALGPFCYADTYFESGGPPSSYIFRGKVMWAFFTERP